MSSLVMLHDTGLGRLVEGFIAFAKAVGLDEVIGGSEVLHAGVDQMVMGALPLAGELVHIEQRQVSLADAVHDPVSWPHAVHLHGSLKNMLTMDVPTELLPWARRLFAMMPPPSVTMIRRGLVATAVQDPNPVARALTRFLVFEAICLIERLTLLESDTRVELLGGRGRDVEVVAERELGVLDGLEVARDELLACDDPLTVLQAGGVVNLNAHLTVLKDELAIVSGEIHEQLDRRRRVLAVADALDPRDQVVLLNELAAEFGEEQYAAAELRRLNPLHFEGLSDSALWKRVERLPGKIARRAPLLDDGPPQITKSHIGDMSGAVTVAELILSSTRTEREV